MRRQGRGCKQLLDDL